MFLSAPVVNKNIFASPRVFLSSSHPRFSWFTAELQVSHVIYLSACLSGVTECQRRGLRCSERGDFLSAQPDLPSGRWRCFNSEGAELEWTTSEKPLTDEECAGEGSAANQRAAFLSIGLFVFSTL